MIVDVNDEADDTNSGPVNVLPCATLNDDEYGSMQQMASDVKVDTLKEGTPGFANHH